MHRVCLKVQLDDDEGDDDHGQDHHTNRQDDLHWTNKSQNIRTGFVKWGKCFGTTRETTSGLDYFKGGHSSLQCKHYQV